MNEYEQQANEFLARFGLKLYIVPGSPHKSPNWGDMPRFWSDREGQYITHGKHYLVTLEKGEKSRTFDFWGSITARLKGKRPTSYDVLSCVSSNAQAPTDPDEVAEEFGPMKPSQAFAIAESAREWQAFFSPEELEALAEIQ